MAVNTVFGLQFEEQLKGATKEEFIQLVASLQRIFKGVVADTFVGQITYSAGATTPVGFLPCDGSAVGRTDYSALFTEIGIIWGAGDGSTTFNLPDLRGRVAVVAGAGSLLTARVLGQTLGSESVILGIADIPSHTHTQDAHHHNIQIADSGPGPARGPIGINGDSATQNGLTTDVAATNQNTGGGGSHQNMQPSAVLNAFIKY